MSLLSPSKVIDDDDRHTQNPSFKAGDKPEDPLNIHRGAIRVPSPDPSLISIDDSNNIRLGRNPVYVSAHTGRRHASHSPAPQRGLKSRIQRSWIANKGLALVLISQLFGTLMNVTTRMLEMEGNDGRNPEYLVGLSHANIPTRQRLPSFPDSLRENVHNRALLINLYVV